LKVFFDVRYFFPFPGAVALDMPDEILVFLAVSPFPPWQKKGHPTWNVTQILTSTPALISGDFLIVAAPPPSFSP